MQVFTLGGKKFVAGKDGELVPFVEKETAPAAPWEAVNNVADVCKILRLSRNSVMRLISSGDLGAVKAGARRWLIPGHSIEAFLRQPR